MTLANAEKWATIVASIVAVLLLLATAIFSNQTLGAANDALRESRSQGWGIQGAMNCGSYRAQVQSLWERRVPQRQIKAWFAAEKGGKQNPYVKGGGETALEDFEDGCGTVDVLVDVLRTGRAPARR